MLCNRIAKALSEHPALRASDVELCNKFEKSCKHFEELALGLLDVCHKESTRKAKQLLRIPLSRFHLLRSADGDFMDCLQLAYNSDSKRFLNHSACQAILRDEWYGDIDHTQSAAAWYNFKLTKEAEARIRKVCIYLEKKS